MRGKIEQVENRAIWIGTIAVEANDFASFPFKDSEASRWKADAAQRAKSNATNGKDGRRRRVQLGKKLVIAMCNGGHDVVKATTGAGWSCTVCSRRSAKKWKLTIRRCEGESKKRVGQNRQGGGRSSRQDGQWPHAV